MEDTRRIGQHLHLIPAWLHRSYPEDIVLAPDDIPIIIDLGGAFGNGSHATTRMCLTLLEHHLRPTDRVLDVGCGTGVLAIAAAKLGAHSVLAVDTEPVAQTVTLSNITLNAVTDQIEFRLGTLNAALRPAERNPNRAFNLIVANLFSGILIQLLQDGLAALLIPNGLFILSGILARQSADVETALAQAGLALLDKQTSDDDWVALVAQRQYHPL